MERRLGKEDRLLEKSPPAHCLRSWSVTLGRDRTPPSRSSLFTAPLLSVTSPWDLKTFRQRGP